MNDKALEIIEESVTNCNSLLLTDERKAELQLLLGGMAERTQAFIAEAMSSQPCRSVDDAKRLEGIINAVKDNVQFVKDELREVEIANKVHKNWVKVRDLFLDQLVESGKALRNKVRVWQDAEMNRAKAEEERLQAQENARAEKERQALLKKAEQYKSEAKKQQALEQAEAIAPVKIKVDMPEKVIKTRREWKIAWLDKKEFIKAVSENFEIYSGYVQIDESALRKAKVANNELELKGVRFEQVTI